MCIFVQALHGIVCFSGPCLSAKPIIGVFHCSSFLWRRWEGGGVKIVAPLSLLMLPKNTVRASKVKLFLGNPAPWIAHQGGHFRSKAENAAEMCPEFLINKAEENCLAACGYIFWPIAVSTINNDTAFFFIELIHVLSHSWHEPSHEINAER